MKLVRGKVYRIEVKPTSKMVNIAGIPMAGLKYSSLTYIGTRDYGTILLFECRSAMANAPFEISFTKKDILVQLQ